jgi:SAM-dependent methyltransferase
MIPPHRMVLVGWENLAVPSVIPSEPPAVFVRADGTALQVCPGFRDALLAAHPSKTPWSGSPPSRWAWAVRNRVGAARARLGELERYRDVETASVLEIGCGAGIDCVVAGVLGVGRTVGIAPTLPLFERGDRGEVARRMVGGVLARLGHTEPLEVALERLPVEFVVMDATQMHFDDATFDVVWSRASLEHLDPLDRALQEIARVVRRGGVVHHAIDPFFWARGCHAKAAVDLPWAHARLSVEDFRRFVDQRYSTGRAERIANSLSMLNQLTVNQWREALLRDGAFEMLRWAEFRSPFCERYLTEHPDVARTAREGLTVRDLVCSWIEVWLRRR